MIFLVFSETSDHWLVFNETVDHRFSWSNRVLKPLRYHEASVKQSREFYWIDKQRCRLVYFYTIRCKKVLVFLSRGKAWQNT
jgi:hypothetical protein